MTSPATNPPAASEPGRPVPPDEEQSVGQLVTSVVIDLVWPPAAGPAPWQLIAMVVVAVASVVVAVPWRRRR